MSIHSSLKGIDTLRGERSVLTRFERIHQLAKKGKLEPEDDSAFGLPKVRTKFKVVKARKKDDDAEAAPAAEGADAEAAE